MPSGHSQHVQLTPNDVLFIVGDKRQRTGTPSGELHFATSREAAFGYCMAPYRPCHGVNDKLDAFFGAPDHAGEVALSGTLCARFFDRRRLFELRAVRDASFEPAAQQGRFARLTRSRFARLAVVGARRIGVVTTDPPVGYELHFLHWRYLAVWDHETARSVLELHAASSIGLYDPELRKAAERLGITLT